MRQVSRMVAGVVAAVLLVVSSGLGAVAAGADSPGAFQVLSGRTGKKVLASYDNGEDGDEFGASFDYQAVRGTAAGGFMVGAPGASAGAGALTVIDARGGTIFQQITAAELDDDLGRLGQSLVQIGHIDSALSVHWAVGAPGDPEDPDAATHVVVLSAQGTQYAARDVIEGEPGSMFGWQVIEVDDGAQDSIIASFAVGAPRTIKGKTKTDTGAVHAYDSVTGERLWSRSGSRKGELFGYSLAAAADQDGDGVQEIVVGAPGNRKRKPAGRVYLLSGRTGAELQRWDAPDGAIWFGFRAIYADVERDGIFELLASAPASDVDGLAEAGSVHVIADNARLLERFDGTGAGEWFGLDLAVVDPELDGTQELQVGQLERHSKARKDLRGRISVLSFDSGKVVTSVRGKKGGDYFGVAGLRTSIDIDIDGIQDRIVGITRAPIAFVPE